MFLLTLSQSILDTNTLMFKWINKYVFLLLLMWKKNKKTCYTLNREKVSGWSFLFNMKKVTWLRFSGNSMCVCIRRTASNSLPTLSLFFIIINYSRCHKLCRRLYLDESNLMPEVSFFLSGFLLAFDWSGLRCLTSVEQNNTHGLNPVSIGG